MSVEAVVTDIDNTNILDLVSDADLILDGTDNFEIRYLINDAAIKLGKRVIPVLVNGARMPRAADLPESLRPLTRRHAVRLTHERFANDVRGLAETLRGDAS